MPLYVIIGHDAPDAQAKRPQVRPAHLAHLRPLADAGRVRLAGPFLDKTGSLIVLEAPSLADVWAIVARDPYVTEGVFGTVDVKPFHVVFPEDEPRPVATGSHVGGGAKARAAATLSRRPGSSRIP